MSEHTPGPWKINEASKIEIIAEGEPMVIARTPNKLYQKESEANARLIAAAPDLLDALTELLNGDHPNRQYIQGHPAAAKARAAISRATGAA